MTDERLFTPDANDGSLRDAFASLAEVKGDGAECPTAALLWDAAGGRASGREREAVVFHLGECTACAVAWRLARELQQEDGARILSGPPRWFRRTWVQTAAAAAVLVVAAGVAVQLRNARRAEFRGQEGDWLQTLVPEVEPLPRDRCLLRWTPGPEGTLYDLRVTTEDLAPVARIRGLERAEFLVPAASLDGVPSGARIVWQVTAHLPDGRGADSKSFTNRVR